MTRHDKTVATKAAAIIAERRITPAPVVGFTIVGSKGDRYRVAVWGVEDASCPCEAGRRNPEHLCSHALAALRMAAAPGHFE